MNKPTNPTDWKGAAMQKRIAGRYAAERRFKFIGLGAVLKILLDTVFNEWDAFNDIFRRVTVLCSGKVVHVRNIRAEDILLDAERKSVYSLATRGTRLTEQRRQQIKDLGAVEERVSRSRSEPPGAAPDIRLG